MEQLKQLTAVEWVGIAGAAAVLLLLLVLFLRPRRPKAEAPQGALEKQTSTAALEVPAQRPQEKEPAFSPERAEADALAAKRKELEDAAKQAADAAARERLAEEARALKDQVEDLRKAAYEKKKAAEAEEKERQRLEREKALAEKAEAEARARAEEAQRQAEAAAAEAKRVQAQAGQTLFQGLTKTRNEGFMARLNGLFSGPPKTIDESVLGELEEILFTADIGVKTAAHLVEVARDKLRKNELSSLENLKRLIRQEIEAIVDLKANHDLKGGGKPHVVMVVGVNGAGKTTTIGKLAARATGEGRKVVLAAGDTFRAAAADQLDIWAERAGAELVQGKDGADPSSVIFEGIKRGQETGADLVIADTAGRLHTKANLMEELKKVVKVIGKAQPGAPHEVLLVLDATMGQNAIAQARQFHEATSITSLALTKLDGTAKGGVIIGICDELKVPVAWAGVGEKIADLRPFEPKEFVEALFE